MMDYRNNQLFELLKVIFCKIEDERNITKPLEFYATSEERSNIDGQLTVKNVFQRFLIKLKTRKSINKFLILMMRLNFHRVVWHIL